MAWVFISITAGAVIFLVFIIIDYINTASTLKPKADQVKREIKQGEMRIEHEKKLTKAAKEATEELQQEIEEKEQELNELERQVKAYESDERRRNPTKIKLDD